MNITNLNGMKESQWSCPACTFLNSSTQRTCEMCESTIVSDITTVAVENEGKSFAHLAVDHDAMGRFTNEHSHSGETKQNTDKSEHKDGGANRKELNVIFIRHGESEENVKVSSLCRMISSVTSFCLPKLSDVKDSLGLLLYELNAPLSPLGVRQALDMNIMLRDARFWTSFEPGIIVHSPLLRAKVLH